MFESRWVHNNFYFLFGKTYLLNYISYMKIETEFPYNDYNGYIVINKENRRHICLVDKNDRKNRTTISYARYLMSIHEKRILNKDEHVDHIDEDKTNDVIDNLQILSNAENSEKSRKYRGVKKEISTLVCPVCGITFEVNSYKVKYKMKNGYKPTCSRSCGGKKSIEVAKSNGKKSRYNNELIYQDKMNGMLNKDIMAKHNISSNGTLHFILSKFKK